MGRLRSMVLSALLCLAAMVLVGMPGKAHAQGAVTQPRLLIYAGPLYKTYLGCLNCDQYDGNSVWDGYSPMGWDNVYANFSRFRIYRDAHNRYSACDAHAPQPPRLVDNQWKFYGFLNVNTLRVDSICGPGGSKAICETLTAMCLRENDPTQ